MFLINFRNPSQGDIPHGTMSQFNMALFSLMLEASACPHVYHIAGTLGGSRPPRALSTTQVGAQVGSVLGCMC